MSKMVPEKWSRVLCPVLIPRRILGGGINKGDWAGYNACPVNHIVCGVRAMIEEWQQQGDDTALNRIQLECCPDTSKFISSLSRLLRDFWAAAFLHMYKKQKTSDLKLCYSFKKG